MKILNSDKRNRKPITRHIYRSMQKVTSITELKAQLIDELKDELPNTLDFDIGFFEGNTKHWLVTVEDLQNMYSRHKTGGEISLWVDADVGRSSDKSDGKESESRKRKRKDSGSSKRREREDDIELIFQELHAQHTDMYTTPQLRLWARMIQCGTHDSYEDPPRVPMITGVAPKRQKKDNLSDAFTEAAKAVAKAFTSPTTMQPSSPTHAGPTTSSSTITSGPIAVGISPGKSVELRRKNLEQLRYVQKLYDNQILSDTEFVEQKRIILDALRKLS